MAQPKTRGPLPHGTTMTSRMPQYQAEAWAKKLRRKVNDPDYAGRTPEQILTGLGMEDEDHRASVLKAYQEGEQ